MMEKTIKINLGGELFQIDEEAYNILRNYLRDIDIRLRNTPGGAETLEDIELRIADIFRSQGGQAGIISKENVEAMMSTIGAPGDFETGSEHRENGSAGYIPHPRKKMYRNPDDTIIGGVCSGIGEYLDIESVWIRLLFIIFALAFGIGFFVYIALWIALPAANTDFQKKEMYGDRYYYASEKYDSRQEANAAPGSSAAAGKRPGSDFGNALNEVFSAIGRVFYIIVRIFLIIVGVCFVLGGFFALVSIVMVFFFRYPDYFSTHSLGVNLFYMPDFLNYVVNPSVAPWILVLSFIVLLMPLLALIYWGVRMIFWFKARDGVISLVALVILVGSMAALSIILFNEGISYSEDGYTVSTEAVSTAPGDLYILSGKTLSGLNYDKDITFDDDYRICFTDDNRNLYIGAGLRLSRSDEKSMKIDVSKYAVGRSRIDASRKSDALQYNYKISGDTLFLDQYFTVPAGSKWSFDKVNVILSVPEGTRVHFDNTTEDMLRANRFGGDVWNYYNEKRTENNRSIDTGDSWIMTEDGLRRSRDLPEKP